MRAIAYTAHAPKNDIINQHQVLSDYAQTHGYKLVKSYSDSDIFNVPSSSLTGLQGIMKSANENAMELVLVHSIELFGTSLSHMVQLVQALSKRKVGITFVKQGLTTFGDEGFEALKVLTHLAECESVKFSHKIKHGMRQAEANGVRLGRPSVINESTESCVIALRLRGVSISNISKIVKIGVGTTYRILREADALACP